MKGLKKLWKRAAGRLAAMLAVCAAAMALTMCDAPTMWQGVSSTASGAGALSGIRFTQSPEPQNYTEGRTPAPVMKAQISAPPAVTRLTVKWYREKDVLRLQWEDTRYAAEVASQSLFADGYTAEGDNTFDTAYTLTADDLTTSGTYYYYAVVEDAIYSAPAMAQINTLGPAVSAVSGGASYQPTTTFVQALSATVTLPADNTAETLSYHWRKDGVNITDINAADTNAAGTVSVTTQFARLEDGRWSYRFEYTPSLEDLTVGETYEYTLKVKNSHGEAASPQGARVTILASTEGSGGATVPVDGDTDGDGYPDEWEREHNYDPAVADTPYGIDLSRKGAVPPGVTWFADTRIYTVQRRAGSPAYRVYQSAESAETDAQIDAQIVVARGAKAAITLDGVTLTPASGSPIDIAPTASLTLLLSGTNRLVGKPGIHVPDGATLTIDSAESGGSLSGVLYAEGQSVIDDPQWWEPEARILYYGPAWPGIGGDVSDTVAGTIVISGGVVIAQGGGSEPIEAAAAIGGGADDERTKGGGTVSINGGLVIAKGGFTTDDPNVATQTGYAYGIGGGRVYDPADDNGTLDISGGTVLMNLQHHKGHTNGSTGPVINGQPNWNPQTESYTKGIGAAGTVMVNGTPGGSVALLDDADLLVNGAAHSITIKAADSNLLNGEQRDALRAGGWSVETQ